MANEKQGHKKIGVLCQCGKIDCIELDMYNRYLRPEPKVIEHIPGLQNAIIVDIDGTLAQKGDRDIFDDSKLHLDSVIQPVKKLLDMFIEHEFGNTRVILMSGRQESCRQQTEQWLWDNNIYYHELFMRKTDDKRCDSIVKKELYEEHVKGKYNVLFVVDDRKRVKRMWTSEGLFVFDVNQYDEEF